MTKLYRMTATIVIKVEADTTLEALRIGQEIAAEIEAELPTGATLENVDGRPEVRNPQVV